MPKHALAVLALPVLFASHLFAQQSPQKPAEASTGAQTPAKSLAAPVNVRLELTITDQRGDVPLTPKVVTVLVGDQQSGRVRTGNGSATLNVDVRPEVIRESRIRTSLSLEYTPRPTDTDKTPPMAISESIGVLLDDGKSVIVSQTADPGSDRRVRVEVKATIIR
jgi:hypothetical protein